MRKMYYLLFTVGCIFIFSNTFAQRTVFMKAFDYNNVKLDGGSTAPGHLKDIEPLSYSQGVSVCGTVGSPCPAVVSDFTIMMVLNPASVTAKQMLLKGEHLKKVDVYYRNSPATFDYYNIHMEDVTITTVQESGSSEHPIVSMSFSAQKIAWQYTAAKADGTAGVKTKTGWDFGTNTEWIYVFP